MRKAGEEREGIFWRSACVCWNSPALAGVDPGAASAALFRDVSAALFRGERLRNASILRRPGLGCGESPRLALDDRSINPPPGDTGNDARWLVL